MTYVLVIYIIVFIAGISVGIYFMKNRKYIYENFIKNTIKEYDNIRNKQTIVTKLN